MSNQNRDARIHEANRALTVEYRSVVAEIVAEDAAREFGLDVRGAKFHIDDNWDGFALLEALELADGTVLTRVSDDEDWHDAVDGLAGYISGSDEVTRFARHERATGHGGEDTWCYATNATDAAAAPADDSVFGRAAALLPPRNDDNPVSAIEFVHDDGQLVEVSFYVNGSYASSVYPEDSVFYELKALYQNTPVDVFDTVREPDERVCDWLRPNENRRALAHRHEPAGIEQANAADSLTGHRSCAECGHDISEYDPQDVLCVACEQEAALGLLVNDGWHVDLTDGIATVEVDGCDAVIEIDTDMLGAASLAGTIEEPHGARSAFTISYGKEGPGPSLRALLVKQGLLDRYVTFGCGCPEVVPPAHEDACNAKTFIPQAGRRRRAINAVRGLTGLSKTKAATVVDLARFDLATSGTVTAGDVQGVWWPYAIDEN